SRYGTRINLDYSVRDAQALRRYQTICRNVLWRYIRSVQKPDDSRTLDHFISEYHEPDRHDPGHQCAIGGGSALEQLCIGSQGVMRRLFTLASKTMVTAATDEHPRADARVVFGRLAAFGGE